MTTNPTSVFKDPYVGEILTTIHDKCVVDLADKTHNNIVHICKSYYIDCLKIQLGLNSSQGNDAIQKKKYIIDNRKSVLSSFWSSQEDEEYDLS